MSTKTWFQEQLEKYKHDPEFLVEKLVLALNETICERMNSKDVSRTELARRLGVSRQFITRLLNGNPNLTLLTLVKIATALEAHVTIDLVSAVQYRLSAGFARNADWVSRPSTGIGNHEESKGETKFANAA